MALFIMLYKGVLSFESVDEILKCDPSTKSCCVVLSVALFIMLYKGVLSFESVSEILKCHPSTKSCCVVLSCGTVYYNVQVGSKF